jgi:hypothetical protein
MTIRAYAKQQWMSVVPRPVVGSGRRASGVSGNRTMGLRDLRKRLGPARSTARIRTVLKSAAA